MMACCENQERIKQVYGSKSDDALNLMKGTFLMMTKIYMEIE
jgi:hypothetical protein